MKIYLQIPTEAKISPFPNHVESDAVPRAGEYIFVPSPETEKASEYHETYFRIVRVGYSWDADRQLAASLALERVEGSNLNEIAD